jgi:hypothetical protein
MGHADDQIEALVLTDSEGNLYAIPRETVEQHRVTGDEKTTIERGLGDDVRGFAQFASQATAQNASSVASAAQSHMASASIASADIANASASSAAAQNAAFQGASLSIALFGAWTSLSKDLLAPHLE